MRFLAGMEPTPITPEMIKKGFKEVFRFPTATMEYTLFSTDIEGAQLFVVRENSPWPEGPQERWYATGFRGWDATPDYETFSQVALPQNQVEFDDLETHLMWMEQEADGLPEFEPNPYLVRVGKTEEK